MSKKNIPTRSVMANQFTPDRLRRTVLEMAYSGSTVHIACSFSIIELLSVLYRNFLRFPNNDPESVERDFMILSKGHGVMAQYACFLELGWISQSHVENYFADGSDLKGLSDSRIPGLEVTSGSLGHGYSVGLGIALGLKRKKTDQKVYIIVGDGELNEGPIWEGALFASHNRLSNVMMIVDKNNFQAMGATDDVLSLGDLSAKLNSFGFEVLEVDGHDENAINFAIQELWDREAGRPKALIAHTIKGKGVSFMEGNNKWHYTRLDPETFMRAMQEVSSASEVN